MTVALGILVGVYAAAGLLYWAWAAWAALRMAADVPHLGDAAPPEPRRWPRLSVIAAARDEADRIGAAARSLLSADYPDLEVIVVDDRSTDGTGAILDSLAGEFPRLRVEHVGELPAGWLGKVHALARGLERASGAFVLFTDADVHFAPTALRRAVAYALAEGLDYMPALPALRRTHLLLDGLIAACIRQLVMAMRPWQLGDPDAGGFLGVGAFNLVRREALDRTEGLEWLRLEVADDAGLALMMKRSGARCRMVHAFSLVELHWYARLGEALRGAERVFATGADFRLARCLLLPVLVGTLELAPLVAPAAAWLVGGWPAALAAGGVFAAYVAAVALTVRWTRRYALPAAVAPLTAPLMAAMVLRAGILGALRGGIRWRDTLYPTATLRPGKRVYVGGKKETAT